MCCKYFLPLCWFFNLYNICHSIKNFYRVIFINRVRKPSLVCRWWRKSRVAFQHLVSSFHTQVPELFGLWACVWSKVWIESIFSQMAHQLATPLLKILSLSHTSFLHAPQTVSIWRRPMWFSWSIVHYSKTLPCFSHRGFRVCFSIW